jgi:hypothetical protein
MARRGISTADINPRYLPQIHAQLAKQKPLNEDRPVRKLPNAESQRDKASALGATGSGEKESVPRTVVRFTGYRVRPLDPDNFAGSVKDLLDGLRHSGIIHGDEPWRIRLETEQVRVRSFKEERTVIEVES